jgi:integrase/recombinase XerD
VRLRLSDIASDHMLIRVNPGKGRKDRSTLLSARLLTALRLYWSLYRPAPWRFTGYERPQPLAIATAPKIYSHAKRVAGITHGKGRHPFRHCFATHLLEAGGDLHTIPRLLGHRTIDTTTRYRHITRRHLAKGHSPFDLLGVAAGLPSGATA